MLLRSFILGSLFSVGPIHAQSYDWGWGPPISVTQNGGTITCTVLDPLTDQIRTTNFTSVASWTHDDGVVATVSPTGTVRAVVYDFDLAMFRESLLSTNSGNTCINGDGVVAWVSGSGTVGVAVYDPARQQWRQDQVSANSGNQIQNRDGVVSWVSAAGTVGAAVYDPGLGLWRSAQLSANSGNVVMNRDGIVAWVSSAGTVGAAVYDPSLAAWRSTQLSANAENMLAIGQGVVAWKSAAGTLGAAAYDWTSNDWRSEQLSSSVSNTMPTIVDGTVHWSNSSGTHRYGFNAAGQWQSNVGTALRCEYHAEVVGSGMPHIAYLWCLSIGASSYSHSAGDGHTITRRWAWKRYASGGAYQPQLTVYSSTTNTTCDGTLNFVGTGVEEAAPEQPSITWAGDRIRITTSSPIGTVEVMDVGGRLLVTSRTNAMVADFQAPLSEGIYLVRCGGWPVQRIAVVR